MKSPAVSEIDYLVEVKFPRARRRPVAREPSAGHFAFPFDRQHHAAQKARRHLSRAPGDHRIRAGLPPRLAWRQIAVRLGVLLDVERALQQAADSGPWMLMAIGDAAGGADNLIEAEQTPRAFRHGQAGDDARHAKRRQHTL